MTIYFTLGGHLIFFKLIFPKPSCFLCNLDLINDLLLFSKLMTLECTEIKFEKKNSE